jgi:two-component system, response regulator RegA
MQAIVVDDDPSVLSIAARWLAGAGYSVLAFADFPTAAHRLRISPAETVVVDVRLGEFNGLQLAHLARRYRRDARIVVMSGWDDPVLKLEAERLGATYLVKPFTSEELLDAIASGGGVTIAAGIPQRAPLSGDASHSLRV